MAGMDPLYWLNTADRLERLTMQAIARAWGDLKAEANKG